MISLNVVINLKMWKRGPNWLPTKFTSHNEWSLRKIVNDWSEMEVKLFLDSFKSSVFTMNNEMSAGHDVLARDVCPTGHG